MPTEERKGDWIQTFTSKAFWPLDPRPEEIDIRDIAHSLSLTCRFNGQCLVLYSVAEHSIRTQKIVLSKIAQSPQSFSNPLATSLWALLHDSAEAYISDVGRPIKRFIEKFSEVEEKILEAIAQKFNLP